MNYIDSWSNISSPPYNFLPFASCNNNVAGNCSCNIACILSFGHYNLKPVSAKRSSCIVTHARRKIRYDEDDDEGSGEDYGYNEDIAKLEQYSESAREVALLVKAEVDDQDVEIFIFRGFSSSLSDSTNPDLSRSILPARAKINSIDRIKGPFNPSDIEYIDKGLSLENFKAQFLCR